MLVIGFHEALQEGTPKYRIRGTGKNIILNTEINKWNEHVQEY